MSYSLTVKEATTIWYTLSQDERDKLAAVAVPRMTDWTNEAPTAGDVLAECINIIRFEDWKSFLV